MSQAATPRPAEDDWHPYVSVLIPVLNEERDIERVIAAMRRQDLSESEFIFADGRSEDRTRSIIERAAAEDPRLVVLDNPARTTAAGLNIALEQARGEFVARMDAHTVYPDNYLSLGIERLKQGDAIWVTGPQVPVGDNRWSRAVAAGLGSRLGTGGSNKWAAEEDGKTGNLGEYELTYSVFTGIWRRETLLAVGGWDTRWPVNQDTELAARLAGTGKIVCLPALAASYAPRRSPRSLARQYFRYGRYRAKTACRHPKSLRLDLLLLPLLTTVGFAAFLSPWRRPRRWARYGIGMYAGLLPAAAPGPDRARTSAALSIMHLAWGAGFLYGMVRYWRLITR